MGHFLLLSARGLGSGESKVVPVKAGVAIKTVPEIRTGTTTMKEALLGINTDRTRQEQRQGQGEGFSLLQGQGRVSGSTSKAEQGDIWMAFFHSWWVQA